MKSLRFRATVGLAAIVGLIAGYCAQHAAWTTLIITLLIAAPLFALLFRDRPTRQSAPSNP